MPARHQGAKWDAGGQIALPVREGEPWPGWARAQLLSAVELAAQNRGDVRRPSLAAELYRRWFNPAVGQGFDHHHAHPLVGLYRTAHAGSTAPVLADGISVVDRQDMVGRDGWWRTWGDRWLPTGPGSMTVGLVFSPRPAALSDFVCTVTAALLDARVPWLLACATDMRRLRHTGSAVLSLPAMTALPNGLTERLRPTLWDAVPALSFPLAPGVGAVEQRRGDARFGARRCHLIAVALRQPGAALAPMSAIADVFAAHGIDPAEPWRASAG